jgi:hypothetical protein
MAQANTEQINIRRKRRVELLSAIYDLSEGDCLQTILIDEAGKNAGIESSNELLSVSGQLSAAGLFELDGGGWTGRITIEGVNAIENQRAPLNERQSEQSSSLILNVNGPVLGGIQAQSPGSEQSISFQKSGDDNK